MSRSRKTTTNKLETSCGNIYVVSPDTIINKTDYSLLVYHGKSGDCTPAFFTVISELVKLCSKYNVPITEVSRIFSGTSCQKPFRQNLDGGKKTTLLNSCLDAIGHILRKTSIKTEEVKDAKSKI